MPLDPTACPPGWHEHRPLRRPPAPGQNPEWDRLEAERQRHARLLEEAETTLGYHDLRGQGLAATRDVYRAGLAAIAQKQANLLAPPPRD